MKCIVLIFMIEATASLVKDEEKNIIKSVQTYDTGELLSKISSPNADVTARQGGYGLVKFEGQPHGGRDDERYGLLTFDGPAQTSANTFKFEETSHQRYPEDNISHKPFSFGTIDGLENVAIKDSIRPNVMTVGAINSDVDSNINNIRGDTGFRFDSGLGDDHGLTYSNPAQINTNINNVSPNSGINGDKQAGALTFQDDNRIEGNSGQNKRKRRRRRKPKAQRLPSGYPHFGQYPGYPGQPGYSPNPPGHTGQFYRPSRRPRPSVASDALSAVTGALSSLALYDDYQCVPRLLCEAAGGGALGAGPQGLLQSVAGLQPLLTLLAAYNGISASPLFVFGRAVFLGMTSKTSPGTCRYAYPLCPTDTEQLVHYLNNHNGGFFRFFGAPHLTNPQYGLQNIEQFYNQLSVPGQYGLHQPNAQTNGVQANFGAPQQNYGLLNHFASQQYPNSPHQSPNLYNGQPNYSPGHPYQPNTYGLHQNRFRSNNEDNTTKLEKRIQNLQHNGPDEITNEDFDDIEKTPKWLFPEDTSLSNQIISNNKRDVKQFKFPEETDTSRQREFNKNVNQFKSIHFPGIQSYRQYLDSYNTHVSNENYNRFAVENNNKNQDVETVYIVRGNGDPNHPEIVKVPRGRTI